MKAIPTSINWHPGLPIFASEPFLKAVGDEYGWLGGFDDSRKLRCILPYTIIRKGIFRLVRFQVQTIPIDGELDIQEEKLFLNNVIDYFHSIRADLIIPATVNSIFRTYPDGAMVAPYGSYIIDLSLGEEALWSQIHSKHRNVIRNAIKKGVKIRAGLQYGEIAYKMVKESFRRSAVGLIDKLRIEMRMDFDSFRQQLISFGNNAKVFVAEYEGVVQGCAVIPFSNYSAYYMHGGSIANPLTGAMNFLQWKAIIHFSRLGVRYYDFCGARVRPEKGTKAEGIGKFKERFGGQFIQGYIWKYPLHPLKYHLYNIAARLRSGGDIVDAERSKLKGFNPN